MGKLICVDVSGFEFEESITIMSKLLKITFEYDDKIRSLEGEAAKEWDKQISEATVVAWVHGTRLTTDKLPWKTTKKKTE